MLFSQSNERLSRRHFLRLGAAVAGTSIVSASLLSACADDTTDDGASGDTDEEEEASDDEAVEADDESDDEDEAEEAASGGNLVYAQNQPIERIDSINSATYPSGYEATYAIFSNVVTFDEDLNIAPDLAEQWETSDDGLVWTFDLRDDVVFHDGTEFDANAIVAHVERIQDPEWESGSRDLWEHITDTNVVDEYQVELITEEPFAAMLQYLAHGSGGIASPAAIEEYGSEFTQNAVGSGPYMVESFTPGSELTLVRFDDYFGETPALDQIVMRSASETGSRVSMLETGEAHVANELPPEQADVVDQADGIRLIRQTGLRTFFLLLNLNLEIFEDAQVRRALNHAVDKQSIVDNLFLGYASVMDSPAASTIPGHRSVGEYEYDPELAREMLADAGWEPGDDGILQKDGVRMEFNINNADGEYPQDTQVVETLQGNLRDVGCDVSLWQVEAAARWDYIRRPASETHEDYSTALFGFNPSNGDLGYHLVSLFLSNPSEDELFNWNITYYSNEEVDQLLQEAQVATDEDERFELLGDAQEIIWNDAPMIWLYTPELLIGAGDEVENVYVWPTVFTVVRDASLQS